LVRENAQIPDLSRHELDIVCAIARFDTNESDQAAGDLANDAILDGHTRAGDALQHGAQGFTTEAVPG
jgi:hypothetical protein